MPSDAARWNAWSPETFDLSRETGKPLLVLLTTFAGGKGGEAIRDGLDDGALGVLIHRNFVPVDADADRLPHIALRHSFTTLPAVVILAPDGSLLAGFTDLEPRRLKPALSGLVACWAPGQRPEATGLGSCLVPYLPAEDGGLERGLEALESIRRRVAEAISRSDWSGRAAQPRIEALRFLIRWSACTGEKGTLARAAEVLHETAHSALYDPVEGGFFGALAPSGPCTYKLLRQNADWLILALRVGVEPGAAFALSLAKGILHYLQTHLLMPGGRFRVLRESKLNFSSAAR